MKGLHRIQWFSIFLLAFCLTACQVKRPKVVISDAKMENVLYDYHIAKAMVKKSLIPMAIKGCCTLNRCLKNMVLRKPNLTLQWFGSRVIRKYSPRFMRK